MICAACGGRIRWCKPAGGYLHTAPLGEFRISRREVDDIKAYPPPPHEPLIRPTWIHPATPGPGG